MGFSASTRKFGDVIVVDVRGRFTLIEGQAIHDLLLDLLRDGRKKVLLNLREVVYLDSSGVGQLIRGMFTAEKHGAVLRAVELSARAQEILKPTSLHSVIADFPDGQSAVQAFSA